MIKKFFTNVWDRIRAGGRWAKKRAIQIFLIIVGGGAVVLAAPLLITDTSFEALENVNKIGNKFEIIAQENLKDRIKIDIGGDGVDFKPEVKLTRWDEVSFKIGLPTTKKISPKQQDGKLRWEDTDIEIEFYEAEDAFKFVWYLNSKPESNMVCFGMESSGLDFSYQPELTQEEIDEGFFRPENVVGSYAIYTSEQKTNWTGGKLYGTGKFGHIYRPKLYDSDGWEVWAERLLIKDNQYCVVMPEGFWENAVYPIKSNDTFGYTSAGASSNAIASLTSDKSTRYGDVEVPTYAGKLDSLHMFGKASNVGQNVDVFVALNIEDSVGSGSHGQVALYQELNHSWTTDFALVSINAGDEEFESTDLILSTAANGVDLTVGSIYVASDTQGTRNYFLEDWTGADSYANAKESPWTETAASGSTRFSIYATYTVMKPVVTTSAVNEIKDTQAQGNGTITVKGEASSTEWGFVWATSTQSDPGDTSPASSTYPFVVNTTGTMATGTFDLILTSLTEHTAYYVRAYAMNSEGYAYGNEVNFEAGRVREIDTTDADFDEGTHSSTTASGNNVELLIVGTGTDVDATQYCEVGETNDYFWIETVQFEDIDETTGETAGGYEDNTDVMTVVIPEQSPEITVITGNDPVGSYSMCVKVWVDWDKDEDLSDETGVELGCVTDGGTVDDTITIPSDFTGSTLMRVFMNYNAYATSCETVTYGEAEDYTIFVSTERAAYGTYTSDEIDISAMYSVDDSLCDWNETLNGGTITAFTRYSTNDGGDWSSWATTTDGGIMPGLSTIGTSTSQALMQYKIDLVGASTSTTPLLHDITLDAMFGEEEPPVEEAPADIKFETDAQFKTDAELN